MMRLKFPCTACTVLLISGMLCLVLLLGRIRQENPRHLGERGTNRDQQTKERSSSRVLASPFQLSNDNGVDDTRYRAARFDAREVDDEKFDNDTLSKGRVTRCSPGNFYKSWGKGSVLRRIQFRQDEILSGKQANREWCGDRSNPFLLQTLGETVQRRLQDIQNPADCASAKKLVVNLSKGPHGLGSYMHLVTEALIMAYATKRTLVLNPTTTNYGDGVWEEYIMPLSETCLTAPTPSKTIQRELTEEDESAEALGITWGSSILSLYSPPAIPEDIFEALDGIHCDPIAWWVGQMSMYAFRLKPHVLAEFTNISTNHGFAPPIAGVHIRRTDKLNYDSDMFEVEEYMGYVEAYFRRLEDRGRSVPRKVYLATDDSSVIGELKGKYPQYKVLSDIDVATFAGQKKSVMSFRGIVLDLFFLSRTNFLVCTLSSNICRAAYELLQTWNVDAPGSIRSLDCHYFLHKHLQIPKLATQDHVPEGEWEISFKQGHQIESFRDVYNGFSIGRNLNDTRGKLGLYPTYKVMEIVVPRIM